MAPADRRPAATTLVLLGKLWTVGWAVFYAATIGGDGLLAGWPFWASGLLAGSVGLVFVTVAAVWTAGITNPTDTNRTEEHRAVEYDVEPIRIRDPVAEALTVVEPGEPFVVTYEDVVMTAGHSCPTASGAYRIAQVGLD
ncbi:MAG: hypothetical protein ABEI98_05175, partial [Halorhabdus sp.]